MQKYDPIQTASIKRSEAYLRKKAMTKPTGYIREFIAGIMFAGVLVSIIVIGLAL